MHRHTKNRCLLRLRELRAIARKRGGRCLSDEYVHRQIHMEFECREGHVWRAMPQTILHGGWCRVCAYVPKDGLETVKAIARERGGWCLASGYVADEPGMLWKCAKGHTWWAKPKTIRRGCWCPTCVYRERRTLADMQALAAVHNGKCVAREYLGHDTCIDWVCEKGHEFSVRPRCVRSGQWCPVCTRENMPRPGSSSPGSGSSRTQALAFAQAQGGTFVTDMLTSQRRIGALWRCAAGHEWTSDIYRVAKGAWCPWCTGRLPTIATMQKMAASRDGRCISTEYVDQNTKLCWECEHGHRWWARPAGLRAGTWCPECAHDERAEQMRSDGKDRR